MRRNRSPNIAPIAVASLLVMWTALSCAGGQQLTEERADWLRNTLFADHQHLWLRDPKLVEHKFEMMAGDPYRFLRGTLPQYLRDVTQDGRYATDFASLANSQILLMGDPHIENFGTFRSTTGDVVVELNDFDSAQYGPFHFDVWRFVSSVFVAHLYWSAPFLPQGPERLPDAESERFARLAATYYVDEITRLQNSPANAVDAAYETENPWMTEVRARSLRRGNDQHPLQKWTQIGSDGRRFRKRSQDYESDLMASDDLLLEVSPDEDKEIRDAIQTYPLSIWSPESGMITGIKDVARRYGAGISSIPLRRIYLLLEGDTASADDDFILEMKEARDPFVLENIPLTPRRGFRQNGERIVDSQRQLQCEPNLDPWLGYTQGEGVFRVRELSGFQDGVDIEKIRTAFQAGDIGVAELEGFVEELARILARSHARGDTLSGDSALFSIADSVTKNPDAVIGEATAFGVHYGERILSDYALFRQLIDAHGAALGFPQLTP